MAEGYRKMLFDLLKQPGNEVCADCGAPDPDWSAANMGIFLCIQCSGVHRKLGVQISVVKSLRLDTWTEERYKIMAEKGNSYSNRILEYNVPPYYKRPTPEDSLPSPAGNIVLLEQWIRAKYERKEFTEGSPPLPYLSGKMKGLLIKKGKGDNNWRPRLFILSEEEKTLKYFVEPNFPKEVLNVMDINVVLKGVDIKTNKSSSMQIVSTKNGVIRNYFVYTENGKDIVDWYMAIRSVRYNLLSKEKPSASPEELSPLLSRDFIKEGVLEKTGPEDGHPWKKRWFCLDGRRLFYYEDKLDASPKGFIYLGNAEDGCKVEEGVSGRHPEQSDCFTIITKERHYNLAADSEKEMKEWMDTIRKVVHTPLTLEDRNGWFDVAMKEIDDQIREQHTTTKRSSFRNFFSKFRKSSFKD